MLKLFAAAALALALPAVQAQDFPTKPVRIVVPWAPGGGADLVARIVGARLGDLWGQTVFVENKPGATGTIGADLVAKGPADGHTLLLSNNSTFIMAVGMMKLPYDPARDLTPISRILEVPHVLSVTNSLPANNLEGLLAMMRATPGEVSFASSGAGSTPHIAGEMFMKATNTKLLHVPYKGAGQSIPDTVAGNVKVSFDTSSSVLPFIQGGKLKPMAVLGSKRLAALPNVPTAAELGVNAEGVTWYGLYGPSKMPEAVVRKIHADVHRVMQMPEVKTRIDGMSGIDTSATLPNVLASDVQAEIGRYLPVLKTIKVD